MITQALTAEQHGASDAESLVTDAQINEQDASPAVVAARILASGEEADAALINAVGWAGVYEIAGLAHEEDAEIPSVEVLAWCERYNAGWTAQLVEIAVAPESTRKAYYAVCDAGGPISVRLDGSTRKEAIDAFERLDHRAVIDDARTHAEDDLGICGADMSEAEFAAALEAAGGESIADLDPIVNAHAGTTAHLRGGWMLWAVRAPAAGQEAD